VTPSYLLAIVDEMERQGVDPRSTSLRVGVFGAEPWTDAMRAEIEGRLGIHAVDIYGLSEVMGPGVGNEAVEEKDGTYLWEDHFYPEVIDPESGEVLPDGSPGELVFTSLTKEAMPVVRYRTRDLTRLRPGASRVMRRMDRIAGRGDDMMIVRGVNLFPSQIEEELLTVPGLAPHFVCVLTRPSRLDELCVRVEARDASVDPGAAARRLAVGVKEHYGVTVEVEVLAPGALERSQGKAQRILDLRTSGS
jgi:phenylacetate-CoA ligase